MVDDPFLARWLQKAQGSGSRTDIRVIRAEEESVDSNGTGTPLNAITTSMVESLEKSMAEFSSQAMENNVSPALVDQLFGRPGTYICVARRG